VQRDEEERGAGGCFNGHGMEREGERIKGISHLLISFFLHK